MVNYFHKLVLKTVQEVGASFYIMKFVFPSFKHLFDRKIVHFIITAQSQERTPFNHAFGQKIGAGFSRNPGCVSAFIHVDNVAGLRSCSAEGEIIDRGFFSVTRDTFTNVGEKKF